jgi:hypothetical protein
MYCTWSKYLKNSRSYRCTVEGRPAFHQYHFQLESRLFVPQLPVRLFGNNCTLSLWNSSWAIFFFNYWTAKFHCAWAIILTSFKNTSEKPALRNGDFSLNFSPMFKDPGGSVAEFIHPSRGDKVPELTLSPQSESMNSATGCWFL